MHTLWDRFTLLYIRFQIEKAALLEKIQNLIEGNQS